MRRPWISLLCLALIVALIGGSLVGCQRNEATERRIVCTSFAAYDWVRAILGNTDTLEPVLLVSDGSDLHSYQPTVADKVSLAEGALVVRVGGESDRWVAELAEDTRILCLSELDGITLREAEILGGAGHSEAHVHAEDEHGEAHSHAGFDEHLWLSLRNASVCVAALCELLCDLDAEHADLYRQNAAAYLSELGALDAALVAMTEAAPRREVLVADRFPFVYLVEEYGIAYCAAFSGCSTEAQASFETVVRLAKQADEWALSHLLVTESGDRRLAASVIAASERQGMTVLALDSMQAVSAARATRITYLSVMQENLEILRVVLS